MKSFFKLNHFTAGFSAVIVGYSSAVVLIIDLAKQCGASPDMVTSWLLALGVGMGLSGIFYSWITKMPVVTAWSTPGAAFLLGSVSEYSLPECIGAFVLCALLSLITAQSTYLLNLIKKIPTPLSNGLLAGILLPICFNIFTHAGTSPGLVALFLTVYFIGKRMFQRYVMLALLVLSVAVSTLLTNGPVPTLALPTPVWTMPEFSLSAFVGLAVPLYLITTLSQNLPGIAIHHAHGYYPNHKPILTGVAVLQAALAPLGGFTFNLAAITAALCMSEDADTEKSERYKAALATGTGYLLLGLLASSVVVLFVNMPQEVIHLMAGLALLPTLESALSKALESEKLRTPALATILCCASGFTLFTLTSPVWGLLLGVTLLFVQHERKKKGADCTKDTVSKKV